METAKAFLILFAILVLIGSLFDSKSPKPTQKPDTLIYNHSTGQLESKQEFDARQDAWLEKNLEILNR